MSSIYLKTESEEEEEDDFKHYEYYDWLEVGKEDAKILYELQNDTGLSFPMTRKLIEGIFAEDIKQYEYKESEFDKIASLSTFSSTLIALVTCLLHITITNRSQLLYFVCAILSLSFCLISILLEGYTKHWLNKYNMKVERFKENVFATTEGVNLCELLEPREKKKEKKDKGKGKDKDKEQQVKDQTEEVEGEALDYPWDKKAATTKMVRTYSKCVRIKIEIDRAKRKVETYSLVQKVLLGIAIALLGALQAVNNLT
jgi:hypothetical protein